MFFVKMQEQINGKIISICFFMQIDIKIISMYYIPSNCFFKYYKNERPKICGAQYKFVVSYSIITEEGERNQTIKILYSLIKLAENATYTI